MRIVHVDILHLVPSRSIRGRMGTLFFYLGDAILPYSELEAGDRRKATAAATFPSSSPPPPCCIDPRPSKTFHRVPLIKQVDFVRQEKLSLNLILHEIYPPPGQESMRDRPMLHDRPNPIKTINVA